MTNKEIRIDLLDALHTPVLAHSQVEEIMDESAMPETRPAESRKNKSYLHNVLEAFALTISGYALGFVIVAIAHYAGLDPWIDSLILKQ